MTGGHPYATQELCYFTLGGGRPDERGGRRARSTRRSAACCARSTRTSRCVGDASAGAAFAPARRSRAEPGARTARTTGARHRLPQATNVQKALAALARRELVASATDGRHAIVEPFLAEWVTRTIESTGER